ncbi:hypothetical protein F5Y17DRAFT_195195 [Xylariaceae sp. FL0594]|nr:hypothetical protein F5Y17DRAFT_195195 [Xylariaceae sp. FL0594]
MATLPYLIAATSHLSYCKSGGASTDWRAYITLRTYRKQLLDSLREHITPRLRKPLIPFPGLSAIVSRYQRATQSAPPPLFSASGRYLPLLYHLVSTLIAQPHNYTVVVVDAEHRFDVTRLAGEAEAVDNLQHVHIYRPAPGQEQVKAAVAAAGDFMLYGQHGSRGRECWGILVVNGTGGQVNTGWNGWLRVGRDEVGCFPVGTSVEEALSERETRDTVVGSAGWTVTSSWGNYVFGRGGALP